MVTLDETIQELRSLNRPVPRPRRLPTAAEVEAAERRLGREFPPDYRRYLLEASDVVFGTLAPAVTIPGHPQLDLVEMVESAWNDGGPARSPADLRRQWRLLLSECRS